MAAHAYGERVVHSVGRRRLPQAPAT